MTGTNPQPANRRRDLFNLFTGSLCIAASVVATILRVAAGSFAGPLTTDQLVARIITPLASTALGISLVVSSYRNLTKQPQRG